MKKIYIKKQEVKYKCFYVIFGLFVYIFSVGFATSVWDDIFFNRSRWLTRKNILEYLQDNRSFKIRKNYSGKSFTFELEDGSELILWLSRKTKEISYHTGDRCVLGNSFDFSGKAIDKQIIEILYNKIKEWRGEKDEKSI